MDKKECSHLTDQFEMDGEGGWFCPICDPNDEGEDDLEPLDNFYHSDACLEGI